MYRAVVTFALLVACGSRSSGETTGEPGDATPADPVVDAPDTRPLGDPVTALAALPGMCSLDGWCWKWPTPHGNTYVRVFSTAPDNIWLTAFGTIMQWDGHEWRYHHPLVLPGQSPAQFPMSIGGTGPSNTWLVYGTTLQQWDGKTWTMRDQLPLTGNPNFNNVWVAPDTGDAFATISNGQLKRWHNGVLQQIDSPCGCFLGSIWGTSSTDVFITTLGAGILHYDGKSYAQTYNGGDIMGAYSGVLGDVWVGGSGHLAHWDGNAWTPVAMPAEIANLDLWINAAGWLATNDVWWHVASGSFKGFLHWDGKALEFTAQAAPADDDEPQFNSVAIIDGRWWMVGTAGGIYTKSGSTKVEPIVHSEIGLAYLFGKSQDDMYAYGRNQLRHWDGKALTPIAIPAVGKPMQDVNPLFNFAAEQGMSFGPIFSMHPGEALLVGVGPDANKAFHYQAGEWTPVATDSTAQLTGVWGPDPDHLWVTGMNGTILKWERATPGVLSPEPDIVTTLELGPIHGVDGITFIESPDDSMLWRRDGDKWSAEPAPSTSSSAGGLLAISPTDILVSATCCTDTRRWNGTTWRSEDNGSTFGMYRLFMPPGGPVFAGSFENGVVTHLGDR